MMYLSAPRRFTQFFQRDEDGELVCMTWNAGCWKAMQRPVWMPGGSESESAQVSSGTRPGPLLAGCRLTPS